MCGQVRAGRPSGGGASPDPHPPAGQRRAPVQPGRRCQDALLQVGPTVRVESGQATVKHIQVLRVGFMSAAVSSIKSRALPEMLSC